MKKIWFCDVVVVLLAVISALFLSTQGNATAFVTCFLTILSVVGLHMVCSRLSISFILYCLLLLFVVFSMILGKMWDFYARIPQWDFWLHFVSGSILAAVGKQLCFRLSEKPERALLCWFVFLFSSAAAGLWEVFEFLSDLLFHMQSQGGSLPDTMTDIIAGNIGCLMILWFLKKQKTHP